MGVRHSPSLPGKGHSKPRQDTGGRPRQSPGRGSGLQLRVAGASCAIWGAEVGGQPCRALASGPGSSPSPGFGEPWRGTEQGRGRLALGPCGDRLEGKPGDRRLGQRPGKRTRQPGPAMSHVKEGRH